MDALDSAGKARNCTVISCYDYSAYPKATAVNSELQVDHVFAHSSYVPVFTRTQENSEVTRLAPVNTRKVPKCISHSVSLSSSLATLTGG